MSVTARPLSSVLQAAAEELSTLAAVADEAGAADISLVQRLQPLDRLSQTLAGLAGFLAALCPMLPECALNLDDLLDAVPVSRLADRLAGRVSGPDAPAGALELF